MEKLVNRFGNDVVVNLEMVVFARRDEALVVLSFMGCEDLYVTVESYNYAVCEGLEL